MKTRGTPFAVLVAALVAVLLWLSGCGSEPGLRERYVAEKLAWRAAKAVNAMRVNPELATDEMMQDVAEIYQEIADRFPPPEDASVLSEAQLDVAAISAQSRLRLAAFALESEDSEGALRIYEGVRDGYSFDRNVAVEAAVSMAEVLEYENRWQEAVAAYGRLMNDWQPAAGEEELPDGRILRAPMSVARGYAARGQESEAREWYERAREYYAEWARRWPGSPTAEVAMGFRAESFLLEERWRDAVAAYEEYDREYGNESNRPAVWLTIADTYGKRLGRESDAAGYYRRVLENYPENTASATAALELADRDIAHGRHETARAMLEGVIERFPHEESVRATALQYLAVSYERDGMWEEAVAQLNVLAREHPTTLYGLMALQHVAERFEELGETDAARVALDRAAEHYERVVRDYSSTPAELAARGYLIDTRIQQERWEDAARLLVETAERFPGSESSANMMIQAADIRIDELGDSEGAADALRGVLRLFPDSEASTEAEQRLEGLTE